MKNLTAKIKTRTKKSEVLEKLEALRILESFDSTLYPDIDKMVNDFANNLANDLNSEELNEIRNYYGKEFLKDTFIGNAFLKPFGYAGDFLMIDKIYTEHCSKKTFHRSWDKFFLNHPAAKAVRNRKKYFKTNMLRILNESNSVSLLNVASGPARDLKELYEIMDLGKTLKSICVDMDEEAIRYAKNLTSNFSEHIDFIKKNIFRFTPNASYDVIWSAGLFDYFDDKTFVFILSRFKQWCNKNGEIIIGNFNSEHNPSRHYMEIFGDWHLYHRSEKELIQLAKKAGFNPFQISIGREEENVNLFLHISN